MTSHWREYAAPIIARVLAETAGQSEKEIKAALREAYPFGPRQYHPYRIWCDEVRKQRGIKKRKAVQGFEEQQPELFADGKAGA